MGVLLVFGVFALVCGFLLLFAPQVVSRITAWSNKVITRTDDLVHGNNKAAGAILILAGIFILGAFFFKW